MYCFLDPTSIIISLQQQLTKYQNNESALAQNLEQSNQKLLDAYKQCEELREHNTQLIQSKQKITEQLKEREDQLEEYQLNTMNVPQDTDPVKEVRI